MGNPFGIFLGNARFPSQNVFGLFLMESLQQCCWTPSMLAQCDFFTTAWCHGNLSSVCGIARARPSGVVRGTHICLVALELESLPLACQDTRARQQQSRRIIASQLVEDCFNSCKHNVSRQSNTLTFEKSCIEVLYVSCHRQWDRE